MLQTNCNRSNSNSNNNNNTLLDSPVDIMKRLEKLNQWQEEQKRLLNERQNMQRQMLGMEQRNMYQMLGLLHSPKSNIDGGDGDTDNAHQSTAADDDDIGSGRKQKQIPEQGDFIGATNDRNGNGEIIDPTYAYEMLDGVTKLSPMMARKPRPKENDEMREITNGITKITPDPNPKSRPKQPFLKRGEGLKQRFHISPDALRLHNLPRYKYATNHPKVRNLQRQRYAPKPKPSNDNKNPVSSATGELPILDAQEKLFRHVLRESEHACSSTPDEKNKKKLKGKTKSPKLLGKGGTKAAEVNHEHEQSTGIQKENMRSAITWAKVLDSQQIQAVSVQEMRSRRFSDGNAVSKSHKHHHDHDHHEPNNESEENLTIFELLERQANEGNIDMNSSCIRRFMKRNKKSASMETSFDSASIPDANLKQKPLRPHIDDLFKNDESLFAEETQDDGDCDTTHNSWSDATNELTKDNDEDVTQEQTTKNTTGFNNDTNTNAGDSGDGSSELFNQFKDALYHALMGKGAAGDSAHNDLRLALQSSSTCTPSPLALELHEKSNLIKQRLAELETEIAAFKENNMELLRAKRAHEQERAEFTQERTEMMDRLKDEKIQMEIYLHDERMKIEEEKRNFQQYVRMHRKAATAKDRKEIERLKREGETLREQLKQREQAHAAGQARLRVQIRNLERDQGKLFEDIERLTKENKKLQAEKTKLERDNNTRMLQAINRNIAKLAPKLSSPTPTAETSPPSKTEVSAKPRSGGQSQRTPFTKTKLSPSPKKLQPQVSKPNLSAPPPSRNTSNTNIFSINVSTNAGDTDSEYDSDTHELLSATVAKAQHQQHQHELHRQTLQQLLHESESSHSNKTMPITKTSPHPTTVPSHTASVNRVPDVGGERDAEDYRREIINEDGSRDIWYPNGNLKKISADGMQIRMLYFNKDIKETNVNAGTVKYYYAETNTWHTSYLDGLEILEFPNGQTEHRHKNGLVEVYFPDNSVKIVNPADNNKLEEWRFADGTNLSLLRNGDRILLLPNGQKEIHTKLSKRREYPDGTIKMVYPDGSQETRYSNGRVRLKDKHGNLISDTGSA